MSKKFTLLMGFCLSACTSQSSDDDFKTLEQGVDSSVWAEPSTLDELGMELRFYQEDGIAMVEYVDCNGSCNESFHSKVVRRGKWYEFKNTDPADAMIAQTYRVAKSDDGLIYENSGDLYGSEDQLRPLECSYRLSAPSCLDE